MSDNPSPTAAEKMADSLPANAKYIAAHQNSGKGLHDVTQTYGADFSHFDLLFSVAGLE
jgi:hypothetical protein